MVISNIVRVKFICFDRKEIRDARYKESVLEQLLSFIRNGSVSNRALPRNIYDEFFEVPHECQPNRISELQFPWLPTVKEFLDAVNQKWAEEPWLNGQSKRITATQEKEEWMYKILTHDCFNHPVVGLQICFVSLFLSRVKRKKEEEEKQPRLQVLGFFTQRTTATPKLSSKLKIIIKKIRKKWSCLICREEGFEGNYR